MSLTSYRAAPPRGEEGSLGIVGRVWTLIWHPFSGPGGDLLSRALRRSTIGPGGLNDRVRNGIGWGPPGKITRSTKRMWMRRHHCGASSIRALMSFDKNDQADRA